MNSDWDRNQEEYKVFCQTWEGGKKKHRIRAPIDHYLMYIRAMLVMSFDSLLPKISSSAK